MSVKVAHDEITLKQKLPSVGQIVRSKMYSTLWRVVEKREIWQHTVYDLQSGECALLPAIYLAYWKVQKGVMPGIGKMVGYAYTLNDNTFESNWDVLEDK